MTSGQALRVERMSSNPKIGRDVSRLLDSHATIVDSGSRGASYRARTFVGLCCESPQELIDQAGFSGLEVTDVTARFRRTCSAWLAAMKELEPQLRRELGDEDFEDERDQKEGMLIGIDEGLLLRSLIICERL